jgi:enoyl-CoA hydratase
MSHKDIHFERIGHLGHILLDRPKAMNALTLGQVHAMHPHLDQWAKDTEVTAVVIEGAGEKAFCAGGDIKHLHDACKARDMEMVATFYRDEYRLNRRIKTMPKPYVALIDGVVMGGGVGVSIHGSHRVATERTLFAMPETGIGFFPDVGGSYFLPRLAGSMGQYLGLTGARLGAADCLAAGIATHFVQSDRLPALKQALSEARDSAEVDATLAGFAANPGPAKLADKRAVIDACFGHQSLDQVLAALESHPDPWAQETLATLRKKSPHLVAVSFAMIKRGGQMSFDQCMAMEFRLSQVLAPDADFVEGVRALLIDKDNAPQWRKPGDEAEIARLFDTVPACGDLTF